MCYYGILVHLLGHMHLQQHKSELVVHHVGVRHLGVSHLAPSASKFIMIFEMKITCIYTTSMPYRDLPGRTGMYRVSTVFCRVGTVSFLLCRYRALPCSAGSYRGLPCLYRDVPCPNRVHAGAYRVHAGIYLSCPIDDLPCLRWGLQCLCRGGPRQSPVILSSLKISESLHGTSRSRSTTVNPGTSRRQLLVEPGRPRCYHQALPGSTWIPV